jgi:hypothetical protein
MNKGYTGTNPMCRDNNYYRNGRTSISTTSSPDSLATIIMNNRYLIFTPREDILEKNLDSIEIDNKIYLSPTDYNLFQDSINNLAESNDALQNLFGKHSP